MAKSDEKERALGILRKGAWFGSVPDELQRALVDAGTTRTFGADELLSVADQPSRGLFAVLEGQVLMTRQAGNDREIIIHIGGPGAWFGEIPVLANNLPIVTVAARTSVTVLHVATARFRLLCDQQPEFLRYFAQFSAQRSAAAIRQLADSLAMSLEDFLRIRLSDLAMMWRADGNDDDVIELALSQADVSKMVGASRQSVNQCLAKLEADGLVEIAFRSIRILQPDKLRRNEPTTGVDWAR